MTIGVFGSTTDPEVKVLQQRVINRGVACPTFDLSRFPNDLMIVLKDTEILVGDFNLLELDAAYLRSSGGKFPDLMKFDDRGNLMPIKLGSRSESKHRYQAFIRYVHEEKTNRTVRQAVLLAFQRHRPLLNPLRPNTLHRLKPFLFHFLAKNGVPVPPFMVASSGDDLLQFSRNNARQRIKTVIKPVAGIFKTELQTEAVWQKRLWTIRGAFYQNYVQGDTIRCYILNKRVIAAAKILFQGTVDSSLSQTGIEVVDLPPRAARIVRSAAEVLDARFCGIDLMREKRSGKYYVIDCNFSPMYVNFARLSRIDVPAYLADDLIQLARNDRYHPPTGVPLLREAKHLLIHDRKIRRKLGLKRVVHA